MFDAEFEAALDLHRRGEYQSALSVYEWIITLAQNSQMMSPPFMTLVGLPLFKGGGRRTG